MNIKSELVDDRQSYQAVDFTKFICAILVIIIHVEPFGKNVSNLNFFFQNYFARIAVPYFFICSGFFLYRKINFSEVNFRYSLKYVKRILRLYLLWTVIYLPLAIRDMFKDGDGIKSAVFKFFRNTIFTGSYSQLWYLPALIFAVLLVSLLLQRNVKPIYILFVAFSFYFIGLFAQSWFGFIKPIEVISPEIWKFLKFVQKIIVTTRDGLFEAFFFVSIGMCFAFYPRLLKWGDKKKALYGFILSMLLLLIEIYILQYLGYIRRYDLYLSLAPVGYFLFLYTSQITLDGNPIYKFYRLMSSLIFYTHIWIFEICKLLLEYISYPLSKTSLVFILTLIFTFLLSVLILKLSEIKRFKFLRKIYT